MYMCVHGKTSIQYVRGVPRVETSVREIFVFSGIFRISTYVLAGKIHQTR